MNRKPVNLGKQTVIIVGLLVLPGLYLARLHNYLLFHVLAELFSIVVACGIFMIAWNARRFLQNHFLLWLGIAYLFVSALDLVHALTYRGMAVFEGLGANTATQLWIAARFLQALSLLAAFVFLRRRPNVHAAVGGYAAAAAGVLLAIFYWKVFPVCYDDAAGRLTTFKIAGEYVLCVLLLGAMVLLLWQRRRFDRGVLWLLAGSVAVTIVSELFFTLYTDPYALANLLGHYQTQGCQRTAQGRHPVGAVRAEAVGSPRAHRRRSPLPIESSRASHLRCLRACVYQLTIDN